MVGKVELARGRDGTATLLLHINVHINAKEPENAVQDSYCLLARIELSTASSEIALLLSALIVFVILHQLEGNANLRRGD